MNGTIYFLIILLAIGSVTAGCKGEGDHAAEITRWKVLYSQEPTLARVDEKGEWKPVTLPFMTVLPYRPKRAFQYLWLKGEINITDPENYSGISLGKVYLMDRVYINGTLVGKHLTADVGDMHYPRNYEIPPGTLVRGENTVHVYLGIYGSEYGGLADRVRLLSKDLFLKTSIFMEFLYRQLTVGIMVLFLAGIVFILMELIWRRLEAKNLIVLMILIIWVSYCAAIFSPYYPVNPDFRITLLWGCASLMPIFFFLYIQYYYRVFLSYWNMIYIPILALCAFLSMINLDTTSPYYLGRVLGQFGVAISLPAHGYLFYYIARRRLDRSMAYFLILGVLPAGVIVWDIINTMYVFHYPPLYHIYSLPALLVLFVTLRIRETMLSQIHLEVLYGRLKYQLGDVTPEEARERRSAGSDMDIMPAMEEKLGKIVEFIKDNYLSDISGKGLAMAMDLSTDRMAAVFKAYTGYRINEYINRLRIDHAARLLAGSDQKIIEIAFAAGYESVVTFNKNFLKAMDMTPGEYRKKHGTASAS